ncbi:hypothetical protein BJ165DRAFT_994312 [Panaeolus papilionaceus]|nr:hypothetical protein BJ165DRAFT_994312 [Panaeolus papilionaceus]
MFHSQYFPLSLSYTSSRCWISAQKRLFYSAHFDLYFKKRGPYVLTRDPSPCSTKFLRTLIACPSLEKYVPWFNILSKLRHLETFILNTPAGMAWIRLDELTRRTIESALHCNPNLQILSLNGMKTVPPSILSHSRHLDGLLVSTIGRMGDFDAEHNAGCGSPTDRRHQALLHSLSMGWCARGSEFQTTIKFFASADCPFSLSSLTSLVLTTSNALPEDLQFIISLCSKSISELTFLAPDQDVAQSFVVEAFTASNQ